MTVFFSRLLRPRPKTSALRITVYSRVGCRCCREAIHILKERQRRHRFSMEAVNIDADPELTARYGMSVPVVAVNGKVRFKGVVNPVLLDRLLWAESRG